MNAVVSPAGPVPAIWTTGTTLGLKTGTWRSALPQHVRAPSPCHAACPVHGDIAEWIGQARGGDWLAAWQTLSRHNPMPAVIGRICHHPCESACNRAGHDEALSICKLERCVGDIALERGWAFDAAPVQRPERVAVVGGGPSGLSAAYQLRRRGYGVTIVDTQPELGGLMRHGIPGYRLARAVLDAEIARIMALGIEQRSGRALDSPQALAELRDEFDAVYLAFGAGRQKRLPQLDYGQPWVCDGADYLARASRGTPPALGPRVLVIGGGSAAMDVARSARRAGHAVTILALEAEAAMPAQREEVVEALEEGIELVDASMLRSATAEAGGLRLDCVRVDLSRAAPGGPFTVAPRPGSEFVLLADAIVSSIGQDPEFAPLGETFGHNGALLAADDAGATTVQGIWAGGDLVSNARFVSAAIGMGERAALAIDRQLRLRADPGAASVQQPADPVEPLVPLRAINLHYHPLQARADAGHREVSERLAAGGEVQLGLDMAQALLEAARCFSCGTCTHCDNCVTYCPDMAVQPFGDGYRVLTDYCKGCGLCVTECPSGSMKLVEELR
jgi:NADPH-dependent glutamate synthase beta subunit-like oxidoreductase/Pyruvate/2-oxoacid:ferredoxin oxidoreductase delta subunit